MCNESVLFLPSSLMFMKGVGLDVRHCRGAMLEEYTKDPDEIYRFERVCWFLIYTSNSFWWVFFSSIWWWKLLIGGRAHLEANQRLNALIGHWTLDFQALNFILSTFDYICFNWTYGTDMILLNLVHIIWRAHTTLVFMIEECGIGLFRYQVTKKNIFYIHKVLQCYQAPILRGLFWICILSLFFTKASFGFV